MIASYLQANPEAGDTIEGITKWWLEFDRIESTLEEVKNALDNLVTRGVVRKCRGINGVYVYKTNTGGTHENNGNGE
jgi:hypothetical protein